MCHHDWEIINENNKEITFVCIICGEEEKETKEIKEMFKKA